LHPRIARGDVCRTFEVRECGRILIKPERQPTEVKIEIDIHRLRVRQPAKHLARFRISARFIERERRAKFRRGFGANRR
jgi:hypothetical protein